jgi:hypothetical protein
MGKHQFVDTVLPPLRPFTVVLPYHVRAVPEDVSYPLEGGPPRQQPGCERMAEAVGMGVLHAGLLEHGSEGPLRYSDDRPSRCLGVPEVVRTIPGSVARQR